MAKTNIKLEMLNPNHAIELENKHVIDMAEFMMLLIMYDNMVKSEKEHESNSDALYELHWIIRDIKTDAIGGLIGLTGINHKDKKATLLTADIQESKMILKSCKLIENYCINTLKLNSVEGFADRGINLDFWKKFGYTTKSGGNTPEDIFFFTKVFNNVKKR